MIFTCVFLDSRNNSKCVVVLRKDDIWKNIEYAEKHGYKMTLIEAVER